MSPVTNFIRNFRRNSAGSVSVETALVSILMISITGAAIEGGNALMQWNSAQQAARLGARIAAVSAPVAKDIDTMTGMNGNTRVGDPMPYYSRACSGATTSCNQGSYDSLAMNKLVFGPDNDGTCAAASRARRGMCDVYQRVTVANVDIKYEGSGVGTAGAPGAAVPLITVTVKNIGLDFVFLDIFTKNQIVKLPDVNVTMIAEDMRAGAL